MSKPKKSLRLSKETVRNLSDDALHRVQGGREQRTYPCVTDGVVCRTIQRTIDTNW